MFNTYLWIIACVTVFSRRADCQGTFNFPDNPQPTPADSSDILPGLEGRQAATTLAPFPTLTTLPTFPTVPTTLPTFPTVPTTLPPFPTLAVTPTTLPPITAVVTATVAPVVPAAQTCICVPTGSCQGGGGSGGEGLLDPRIVTNISMFTHLWTLAYLTVVSRHTDLFTLVQAQGTFNFPDSQQPIPSGYTDTPPGLDGRQAATTLTTLPGFPTLGASIPTTIPVATNVINPNIVNTGQTCICVPTGSCVPGVTDGSIDIRIVTSVTTGTGTGTTLPTGTGAGVTSCVAGLVLCCQPGPYQCGVRYPPIAGAPVPAVGQAPYGSYPWQAVLLAPGDVYLGSGVLLNNLNVLTVAHRASQYVNAPTTLKVRLGEWNAGGATEPLQAQEYIVSRITLHPNYNAANLKNDVAILRLSTIVPLGNNPAIATGCLPATSFVGTRCFMSGWGRNDFTTGSYQTIQKQVDVPILQTAQCQAQLAATRLGATFVFDPVSFICAGGEPGKDACTGDGGAPLMCAIGNRWFIAGLVAWGIGCGATNVPGVYVNVASYVPWIQTTVAS